MMRQLSHIFFAEALTFIFGDPASVLDRDVVPKHQRIQNQIPEVFDVYILGGPSLSSPSISTTSNCHRKVQPIAGCCRKCREVSAVVTAGAHFTVDSFRTRAWPPTTSRVTLPSDCELFLLSACAQIHRNTVVGVDRVIEDQAQTRYRDEPATIIREPI